MKATLARLLPDPLVLLLLCAATLAVLWPARDSSADALSALTKGAVGLLFFLHGARLPPRSVLDAVRNWRLHLTILCCSFALFPLLVWPMGLLVPGILQPEIYMGFLYLSILPSTIQSSIAFTSMAGGNVPAAVAAASTSNIVGVVLTPLLASAIFHISSGSGNDAIEGVAIQILLPFALGQVVQRFIGGWVARHAPIVRLIERGSILCVVYLAFSDATVDGAWSRLEVADLALLVGMVSLLLAAVLSVTWGISRTLGFCLPDEIAIVFCGSKKSIGSGLPMANIIFAGQSLGLLVLPMIIYHQVQLLVCAVLSERYSGKTSAHRR